MIRLEKVNGRNVWELLKLEVSTDQKSFVASNDISIVEAYTAITGNGYAFPFGIYEGNKPVGFLMIGFDVDDYWDDAPDIAKGNYNLWRLMIDKSYQGKGYGKDAVRLALDFIKTFPCGAADYCWLSYEPENEIARELYGSFGFNETGEMDGEELSCDYGDMQMDTVSLKAASRDDLQAIWEMQINAFSELLDKYQDYDMSPAAESIDKVLARYEQPWTTYFFIMANDEKVGVIRVVDKKDESRKRISPIWIMPEHRNKGFAKAAITAAEKIYGSHHWCLDTILQESGNLHLYEKMGYHQTGRIDKVNERMDIVFYEKD